MKSTITNIIALIVFLTTISITANLAYAQDKPPSQILIINAQVFDGVNDKLSPANILIEGKFIKTISSENIQPNQNVTVIDATGLTLTPGLIDMHQHILLVGGTQSGTYDYDAYTQGARGYKIMYDQLFMRGFTTIREIAGNTLGMSRAIRADLLPGPRIYSSGPAISATGGHGDWGSYNDAIDTKDYQEKFITPSSQMAGPKSSRLQENTSVTAPAS